MAISTSNIENMIVSLKVSIRSVASSKSFESRRKLVFKTFCVEAQLLIKGTLCLNRR